jgi:hypothetical protein
MRIAWSVWHTFLASVDLATTSSREALLKGNTGPEAVPHRCTVLRELIESRLTEWS